MSDNEASGEAVGVHLGVLYQLSPLTRFGLVYHSRLQANLRGTSTYSGFLANNPPNQNPNFGTDITLPPWIQLSAFHQFDRGFAGLASVTYTEWSTIQDLTLNNVESNLGPHSQNQSTTVVVPERFKDTWNFALGGHFTLTPKWLLKAGVGYDYTPVRDEYRGVQLPDGDHFVFSSGFRYRFTPNFWLDVGYSYILPAKVDVNGTETASGPNGADIVTTASGTANGSASVYGVQLTWNLV